MRATDMERVRTMRTSPLTHPSFRHTRIAVTYIARKLAIARSMSIPNATARLVNDASGTPSNSAIRALSWPEYTGSLRMRAL